MKTFFKLAKKIESDLGLIVDSNTIHRTYVGKWQKTDGAFVWECKLINNGLVTVGSCQPAHELIRKNIKLSMEEYNYGLEIEIYGDKIIK